MTRSDDDAGEMSRPWEEVPVERDDAALEAFLARVHALGQGPAPAPDDRLAALLGVSPRTTVRRIAPRTVAGATALGLAALFGTGWAAAAADQLPGPAQRTVARLAAGWLPGIPHPELQRSTPQPAAVEDPGPLPTTTTPDPTATGADPAGAQPVRREVPTGTGSARRGDGEGDGRETDERSGAGLGSGDSADSGTRVENGGSGDRTGDGGSVGVAATPAGSGAGSDDGAEERQGDAGADTATTGDEGRRSGSGTSSDDRTDR